MRTKRVLRYYCDHCKKAGCGKAAMILHEGRCIKNPNRTCGFCKRMGHLPLSLEELRSETDFSRLRVRTFNCPACLLAGLAGTSKAILTDFDYKAEVQRLQDEQRQREEHAEMMATY